MADRMSEHRQERGGFVPCYDCDRPMVCAVVRPGTQPCNAASVPTEGGQPSALKHFPAHSADNQKHSAAGPDTICPPAPSSGGQPPEPTGARPAPLMRPINADEMTDAELVRALETECYFSHPAANPTPETDERRTLLQRALLARLLPRDGEALAVGTGLRAWEGWAEEQGNEQAACLFRRAISLLSRLTSGASAPSSGGEPSEEGQLLALKFSSAGWVERSSDADFLGSLAAHFRLKAGHNARTRDTLPEEHEEYGWLDDLAEGQARVARRLSVLAARLASSLPPEEGQP